MPNQQCLTGRDLRNAILFAALVYLGIRFISQIVDILLIFSITIILVLTLNPAVSWLEKHKIPRAVSAGVLAIGVIAGLVILLFLAIPPIEREIVDLGKQAPSYYAKTQAWVEGFSERHPTLASYLPSEFKLDRQSIQSILKSVLGGATKVTANIAGTIVAAALIFITTIYTLANPKPIIDGFLSAASPRYRTRLRSAGERISKQIRAWAMGTLLLMFAIFILTWIGLSLLGIKQAFLFAVIAGLLEAVPTIGPVLSAIPPIIVALISNPISALWVALLFIGIQQFENQVLVPMIMARQLSLHPVTIIFYVLVMGGLFGIIGIFLATPIAVTVGILYDEMYLCEYRQTCNEDVSESSKEPNEDK